MQFPSIKIKHARLFNQNKVIATTGKSVAKIPPPAIKASIFFALTAYTNVNTPATTQANKTTKLIEYIIKVYKTSFDELTKLCRKLMPRRMLDVKLEAWLCALGHYNEIVSFQDVEIKGVKNGTRIFTNWSLFNENNCRS